MMPWHEVIRESMKGGAEAFADETGKSASRVYKFGELPAPDGPGSPIPGNLIVPFCKFFDTIQPVEYLANKLGYIVYKIPESSQTNNDIDRLALLIKEFSEGLHAASQALEDGKITLYELENIEKEFLEFITVAKSTLEYFRHRVNGKEVCEKQI